MNKKLHLIFALLPIASFLGGCGNQEVFYNIEWRNYDQTVLDTSVVKAGEIPEYQGVTPIRENDAQYTYTFDGWEPDIAPASKDTIYVAKYKETTNQYTVTWKNYDGTVLDVESYNYGDLPSYKRQQPTREKDAKYTYSFYGWSPSVTRVIDNAIYYAEFESFVNQYTVTWKNYDGADLDIETYDYGSMPVYKGNTPKKEKDAMHSYNFIGWSPAIETVTKDVIYFATFNSEINKYKIIWENYDGKVIYEEMYDYGSIPIYKNTKPIKEHDENNYYIFAGWNKNIEIVTCDATYIAVYDTGHKVRWLNGDGSLIYEEVLKDGSIPSFNSDIPDDLPTIDGSTQRPFIGWSPVISRVSQNIDYIAQFGEKYGFEITNGVLVSCSIRIADNISIPSSVISIGNNAFQKSEFVKSISIPDSVTSIGDYAFSNCKSLLSIDLPESVTKIGTHAFEYCESVEEIVIPDSVRSIGLAPFYMCTSLKKADISKSLSSTTYCLFTACPNIEYIACPIVPDSARIADARPYMLGGLFAIGESDKNSYVSETIIYTESYWSGHQFIEGKKTTMTFPKSFKTFVPKNKSHYIFNSTTPLYRSWECSTLENIVLDDVTFCAIAIPNPKNFYITKNTKMDLLVNVGLQSSASVNNLYFCGTSADWGNTIEKYKGWLYWKNLYFIDENGEEVHECDYLNGYDTKYYKYKYCSSVEKINISSDVTCIGDEAFNGCKNLKMIDIPINVTSIGKTAFYDCSSLEAVNMYDSVQYIGSGAFYNCKLKNVYIHISSIENYLLMSGKENLNSFAENVHLIDSEGMEIEELTIPDGVKEIKISEFQNCKSIKSIVMSDSVTIIADYAFSGCKSLDSIELSSNVKNIGNHAFENCESLKNINVPNCVSSIGSFSFSNCSSLLNFTIPYETDVINEKTFYNCVSLTNVITHSGLKKIGDKAFSKCYFLNSIVIPESIEEIGEYAFADCSSLLSITIPGAVKKIGEGAFSYCTQLSVAVMQEGLSEIAFRMFESCTSLKSVIIPESVSVIGNSSFADCSSLLSIVIPKNARILSLAFSGCTSLCTVVISEGVTEIGSSAFYGCVSITSITIPASVVTIYERAFYNCSSLSTVVVLGNTIFKKIFGIGVFSGCIVLSYVFYKGNDEGLESLINNGVSAGIIYLYSEEVPTDEGNYWHYVNGEPSIW